MKALAVALLFAVACAFATDAAGQSKRASAVSRAVGSVEGDVYLVMQNGDTKRGAGRTVFLEKDDGLRDTVRAVCLNSVEKRRALMEYGIALADSERLIRNGRITTPDAIYDNLNKQQRVEKGVKVLEAEGRLAALAAIGGAVVDSAGTGMNAHYRFVGVMPGSYVLFSEWIIGDNQYVWWAPLKIEAGRRVVRDLDNSVAADKSLLCM